MIATSEVARPNAQSRHLSTSATAGHPRTAALSKPCRSLRCSSSAKGCPNSFQVTQGLWFASSADCHAHSRFGSRNNRNQFLQPCNHLWFSCGPLAPHRFKDAIKVCIMQSFTISGSSCASSTSRRRPSSSRASCHASANSKQAPLDPTTGQSWSATGTTN